jgi:uncharacterized protein YkwD
MPEAINHKRIFRLIQIQPIKTATSKSIPAQNLKAAIGRQRLPRIAWIFWIPMALGLVGCEPATELLRQLPGQDVPEAPKLPESTAQSPTIAQMEASVRQRINEVRQKNGLNPLQNNEKLARVARNYSQKMARENFFSHVSPDGSTLAKRVRAGGISYWMVGENLFKSVNAPQPVPLAVEGWMNSPGHRANILQAEYAETGIGVWRQGKTYYITQLFLRSQFSPKDLFK